MTRISRFPVPEVAELPEDLRERILQVQDKTGFVPNVFLGLAHRPDELRAFLAYHDAVMEREGGLTKAEREMVVVATSAASRCTYCVVAHGAILRIRAKDPLLADLVAIDHRQAVQLSDRQHAMLDYAVKLSRTPELVDDGLVGRRWLHGLDLGQLPLPPRIRGPDRRLLRLRYAELAAGNDVPAAPVELPPSSVIEVPGHLYLDWHRQTPA